MTSPIVIDSGIVIATLVKEPFSEKSEQLLEWVMDNDLTFCAPTLILYEITATLRKLVHRRLLNSADGENLLRQAFGKSIEIYFDTFLLERAYTLASEKRLPSAYDAQYLALSEKLDCDFWTLDKRLYNTVKDSFPRIRYVAEFNS